MDAASLIPRAEPIPVASTWFEVLLLGTFVAHLLLMNTALGWSIIALVEDLRGKPAAPAPETRLISKNLPGAMALTVNFGVAPLLFLQVLYGQFMYVSSTLMAVFWLPMFVLAMGAYYAAYVYDFRFDRLAGARALVMGLAVLLLLSTSFLFSNNMTLMLRPEAWFAYFDHPGGTLLNLADPTLFPRWLHFVVGSMAVGGLALALFNRSKARKAKDHESLALAEQGQRKGMTWFAMATAVQLAVGTLWLFSLPPAVRGLFLGQSVVHTAHLAAATGGALACLVFGSLRLVRPALWSLLATMTLMVALRDLLRRALLEPYFKVADLVVKPEYSTLILFLASLVFSLVVIGVTLKWWFETKALAPQAEKEA